MPNFSLGMWEFLFLHLTDMEPCPTCSLASEIRVPLSNARLDRSWWTMVSSNIRQVYVCSISILRSWGCTCVSVKETVCVRKAVTVALALSVWPAEIIFDSSGDKLRQVWLLSIFSMFSFSPPPIPQVVLLEAKPCNLKYIESCRYIAPSSDHPQRLLMRKNDSAKPQLSPSTNRVQNGASYFFFLFLKKWNLCF